MSLTSDYFDDYDLESRPLVSYFYCDFRNQDAQSAIKVVGSLVAQLCSQIGSYPVELETAFEASQRRSGPQRPPSFSVLLAVLQSLSRLHPIILLVDAIDECDGRRDLLDFLASLQHSTQRISILVTSRDEVDIRDTLSSFTHVRLETYVKDVDQDIRSYVEHRLTSDSRLRKLQSSLKADIKDSLSSKSAGM